MPLELTGKHCKLIQTVRRMQNITRGLYSSLYFHGLVKRGFVARDFFADCFDYRLHFDQTSFAMHFSVQKICHFLNKLVCFDFTSVLNKYFEATLVCAQSRFTETRKLPASLQCRQNSTPVDRSRHCESFNRDFGSFFGICQRQRWHRLLAVRHFQVHVLFQTSVFPFKLFTLQHFKLVLLCVI